MQQGNRFFFVTALAKRTFISLLILLILRIGLELPIPNINYQQLFLYDQNNFSNPTQNLVRWSNLSFFNLNIGPYLYASLLIQSLISIFPQFKQFRKEGLYGKRNFNDITRRLTFIIALTQSGFTAWSLKEILSEWSFEIGFIVTITLTTGAMIVFWLSEFITDYGLGKGPSLFVAFNIFSNFLNFLKVYSESLKELGPVILFIAIIVICIAIFLILFLQLCWVKISLISAKILNPDLRFKYNEKNNLILNGLFLPVRLDLGGVFPVILTGAILYVLDYASLLIPNIKIIYQFFYWIIFFSLTGIFNAFLSLVIINPKTLSLDFKERAITIKNITSNSKILIPIYLKSQVIRTAFTGSIFLSILGILSNFLIFLLRLPELNKYGLTSLLIILNVIAEIQAEIEDITSLTKSTN